MQPIEIPMSCYPSLNPFAPPDRRYRIARTCLDAGRKLSLARYDKFVFAIWRFMKNREAALTSDEHDRLIRNQRDLFIAFRLRRGRMRPLAEAYILGGAEDACLASKLALPTESIRWFRLAFYDIEHLRPSPLHVIHDLIGVVDAEGRSMLDMHRLWKLIAYQLGPAALDRFFHDVQADEAAFKAGGLVAWFSRHTQLALQAKQLIALSNQGFDDEKHLGALLGLARESQHRQDERDRVSPNAIEQHINAMMLELPWTHGTAAREVYKDTEIGKYDDAAAELRDEELLLLAAGETVPGLEYIKDLSMNSAQKTAATDKPDPGTEK
ncbi:MAG: hypothetical protein WCJ35_26810 [Planctomycetota bacterium]